MAHQSHTKRTHDPGGTIDVVENFETTYLKDQARVSENDQSQDYLKTKIVAGAGVAVTELNDGATETLEISAPGSTTDEKVKVSPNDTTPGELDTKVVAGAAITLNELNDGANETLEIVADAHALGGAQHDPDTLANLNTKVSDATLIDTADARLSDARTPTAHDLGGAEHGPDTLANLNAKVSDATLIDTADARLSDDRNDPDAIHDDVAGEIVLVTDKPAPVDDDVILIEDSEDSDNKKSVKMSNLPGNAKFSDFLTTELSSNQNDYDPGDASIIRLNVTADSDITGLNVAGGSGAECFAADFDGATDFLQVLDNAEISVSGTDSMVGGWLWLDDISSDAVIWAKGLYTGTDDKEHRIYWSNPLGQFIYEVSSNGTNAINAIATNGPVIAAKTWYYIEVWHIDGVSTNIAINRGTPDTTAHVGGINDSAERLVFGGQLLNGPVVGAEFPGRLQSWNIWKTIPSAAVRDELYNAGTAAVLFIDYSAAAKVSLVAQWDMDEENVTRVDNVSTNDLTQTSVPRAPGHCAGGTFRNLRFYNVGTFAATFKHQDVLSASANRLLNEDDVDLILSPDELISCCYDPITSRWRADYGGDPSAVQEADYDANTILAANADDTPLPLTVPVQTLVGRITAGDIDALTPAEVRTLINVEDAATADQSDAEIKTAYENNADTNEYSDAEQTKLGAIEASATADQSDAEIKTAYENNADTNEYSDAEQTKLAGIETAAITGGRQTFSWVFSGVTTTGVAKDGFRSLPRAGTIESVVVLAGAKGNTGTSLFDVNKSIPTKPITTQRDATAVTTIYTTQGNRPDLVGITASSGDNAIKEAVAPDVTTFVAGDFLSVDADSVVVQLKDVEVTVTVKYD